MLTTREVRGVRVCRAPKPGKELTKDGLPRRGRKIGKVSKTVFDPSGMRVVGFIVRRPDLLWMFKRSDRFIALDAIEVRDGVICPVKGMDSWDDRAIKRMGVDWDTCIIWEGMPVRTSSGEDLGRVDDISFDEETGEAESLFLDDGGTARALVGSVEIPKELMVGYDDGLLIVKSEAAQCKLTGGLAAKAGEATAKVGIAAREGAHTAGKAVGKAVDKGSYGLGKAIGRIKRSVSGAAEEFKKEAPAPAKKPAAKTTAAAKATTAAKATAAKTASAKATSTTKTTAKATGVKATTAKTASTTSAQTKATSTKPTATKSGATKAGTAKSASSAKSSATKTASAKAATTKTSAAKATAAKSTATKTTKATATKTSSAKASTTKSAASQSASKASSGSAKKTAGAGSTSVKKSTTSRSASAKAAAPATKKSAGQAAVEHLKSAGGMFSGFKEEFDKARRDDS